MSCQAGAWELKAGNEGLVVRSEKGVLIAGGKERLLWRLVAYEPRPAWQQGRRCVVDASACVARTESVPGGFALCYDALGTEEPFARMSLRMVFREDDGGFVISATIRNDAAGWTVCDFAAPGFAGVDASRGEDALLWPNGLGQRFRGCAGVGTRRYFYPGGQGTMPWFALAGPESGLYVGSHDPAGSARHVEVRVAEGRLDAGITHYPFCAAGGTWTMPPFVIRPYVGDWHEAARIYRRWFDAHGAIAEAPAWVAGTSGWLLAILKQQNGDVMWDYRTGIDRLCDICAERGLNMLGLFGWAHGGHDYLYPEFIPDNLMGGKKALADALARARKRGIRTILYAQGMVFDASTDYYRHEGNDVVALGENSEPYVSSIRKFHSATPVPFAMACHGSDAWLDKLIELAEQANTLGADGILYDQVGVYAPAFCYARNHRHATPSTAFAEERQRIMRDVVEHMRRINPDFIVMIEGVFDTLMRILPAYHGWGFGCTPHQETAVAETRFAELFRYTFPELVMTIRYPQPLLDRHNGHYACVYGLRHELETRYRADVACLLEGARPTLDDYADTAYWPPYPELIHRALDEGEKAYMARLLAFEKRQEAFLWRGRFVDTEGFVLADGALVGKAFHAADGRLGVVVWNPTGDARAPGVTVPGRRCVAADAPEGAPASPDAPLAPESVRMLVFA